MFLKTAAHKNFFKLIGVCTMVCFCANQVWASFPQNPAPAGNPVQAISVPASLGTIQDSFFPSTQPEAWKGRLLIHIQDAHGVPEAQKSIESLLDYLQIHYGLDRIYLEGAVGDLDTSRFHFSDSEAQNEKIWQKLFAESVLSGSELYLLKHSRGEDAQGVEDEVPYAENLRLFKAVMAEAPASELMTQALCDRLDLAATRILSPASRELFRAWWHYEDRQEGLMDFLKALLKNPGAVKALETSPWKYQVRWPSLTRLIALKNLEGQLDPEKIRLEKEAFLNLLRTRKINPALISALEERAGQETISREGESARSLFEKIFEALGPQEKPPFAGFPHFIKWGQYQILSEEINAVNLAEETEQFAREIAAAQLKTAEQKSILKSFESLLLLKKAMNLELSRKDWERVLGQKEKIRPGRIADDFNQLLAGKRGVAQLGLEDFKNSDGVFENAVAFYRMAVRRDSVLMNLALRDMEKMRAQKSVLITGGFHGEGIKTLLRQKGVAYVQISPALHGEVSSRAYVERMMRGTVPPAEPVFSEVAIPVAVQKKDVLRRLGEWDYIDSRVEAAIQAVPRQPRGTALSSAARRPPRQSRGAGYSSGHSSPVQPALVQAASLGDSVDFLFDPNVPDSQILDFLKNVDFGQPFDSGSKQMVFPDEQKRFVLKAMKMVSANIQDEDLASILANPLKRVLYNWIRTMLTGYLGYWLKEQMKSRLVKWGWLSPRHEPQVENGYKIVEKSQLDHPVRFRQISLPDTFDFRGFTFKVRLFAQRDTAWIIQDYVPEEWFVGQRVKQAVEAGDVPRAEAIIREAIDHNIALWGKGLFDADAGVNIPENFILTDQGVYDNIDWGAVTDDEERVRAFLDKKRLQLAEIEAVRANHASLKQMFEALARPLPQNNLASVALRFYPLVPEPVADRLAQVFLDEVRDKFTVENWERVKAQSAGASLGQETPVYHLKFHDAGIQLENKLDSVTTVKPGESLTVRIRVPVGLRDKIQAPKVLTDLPGQNDKAFTPEARDVDGFDVWTVKLEASQTGGYYFMPYVDTATDQKTERFWAGDESKNPTIRILPQWATDGMNTAILFVKTIRRPGTDQTRFGTFTDLKWYLKDLKFNADPAKRIQLDAVLLLPFTDSFGDSPYEAISPYAIHPKHVDWDEVTYPGAQTAEGQPLKTKEEKYKWFKEHQAAQDAEFQAFLNSDLYEKIWEYADVKSIFALRSPGDGPAQDAVIRGKSEYHELAGSKGNHQDFGYFIYEQYIAHKQVKEAVKYVYEELGIRMGFDIPFFPSDRGSLAFHHPDDFVWEEITGGDGQIHKRIKAPRFDKGHPAHFQTWYGQGMWNYTELRKVTYEPVLAPFRYWRDIGFRLARWDAAHMGPHDLHKAMNDQDIKGQDFLLIPEQLGGTTSGPDNDRESLLKNGGLLYHNPEYDAEAGYDGLVGTTVWHRDDYYFRVSSTHDSPRMPWVFRNVVGPSASVEEERIKMKSVHRQLALSQEGYTFVQGDEWGHGGFNKDDMRINVPLNAEEIAKGRKEWHWDLASPMDPSSQRYDQRAAIASFIRIRKEHEVLRQPNTLHYVWNTAWGKVSSFLRLSQTEAVLVINNLSNEQHRGELVFTNNPEDILSMQKLGIPMDRPFAITNLETGQEIQLSQQNNRIHFDLEPGQAYVFDLKQIRVTAQSLGELEKGLVLSIPDFISFDAQGKPAMYAGGRNTHFGDQEWGRDFAISMTGLNEMARNGEFIDFPEGRKPAKEIAKDLIRRWAGIDPEGRAGMDPNDRRRINPLHSSGDIMYNVINWYGDFNRSTVDAPLWFVEAVFGYVDATQDTDFLNEVTRDNQTLLDVLWQIVDRYGMTGEELSRAGINPHSIQRDAKTGFILVPRKKYTWMDTEFTERQGYPVEIQALWFNALNRIADLTGKIKPAESGKIAKAREIAAQVEMNFPKYFWNEETQHLYDLLGTDGLMTADQSVEKGWRDPSNKPNQLFAVYFGLLKGDKAVRVMKAIERELLIPGALRSLSPKAPHYRHDFEVAEKQGLNKNAAYHSGLGWVWLYPFYYMAAVDMNLITPADAERQINADLEPIVTHSPRRSLPELLSGNAYGGIHARRGPDVQSWSVMAAIAALRKIRARQAQPVQALSLGAESFVIKGSVSLPAWKKLLDEAALRTQRELKARVKSLTVFPVGSSVYLMDETGRVSWEAFGDFDIFISAERAKAARGKSQPPDLERNIRESFAVHLEQVLAAQEADSNISEGGFPGEYVMTVGGQEKPINLFTHPGGENIVSNQAYHLYEAMRRVLNLTAVQPGRDYKRALKDYLYFESYLAAMIPSSSSIYPAVKKLFLANPQMAADFYKGPVEQVIQSGRMDEIRTYLDTHHAELLHFLTSAKPSKFPEQAYADWINDVSAYVEQRLAVVDPSLKGASLGSPEQYFLEKVLKTDLASLTLDETVFSDQEIPITAASRTALENVFRDKRLVSREGAYRVFFEGKKPFALALDGSRLYVPLIPTESGYFGGSHAYPQYEMKVALRGYGQLPYQTNNGRGMKQKRVIFSREGRVLVDEPVTVFPGVYHPWHDNSSQAMIEAMTDEIRPGMNIYIGGLGSGFDARYAARLGAFVRGVDVNEGAIPNVFYNFETDPEAAVLLPRLLEISRNELFADLKEGEDQFDLIFFNLPSNDTRPEVVYDYSFRDPGRNILDSLIANAVKYLKPGGKLVFVHGEPWAVRQETRKFGIAARESRASNGYAIFKVPAESYLEAASLGSEQGILPGTYASELSARQKLDRALAIRYGAEVDDIDGNLTQPGTSEVTDSVVKKVQNSIHAGNPRGFASGRAETRSDEWRKLDVHDIEEVAARVRAGLSPEDLPKFMIFPENGSYAVWYEWNAQSGSAVRQEVDLAKHYGLVTQDFELTETERAELFKGMSALREETQGQPLVLREDKRYGFAAWLKSEGISSEQVSRQANELVPIMQQFLDNHPNPKFHIFEVVATSVSVDLMVKGVNKTLATKFMAEKFGLKEEEIAATDDKASRNGNGWAWTNRLGGFSTDEHDPESADQVPLKLAIGVKGVEAWFFLQQRLQWKQPGPSLIAPQQIEGASLGLGTSFRQGLYLAAAKLGNYDFVANGFSDADAKVRRTVLALIDQANDPELKINGYIRALRYGDSEAGIEAIKALEELQATRALDALMEKFYAYDFHVRKALVQAIGTLGDKDTVAKLAALIQEKVYLPYVVISAAHALAHLGKKPELKAEVVEILIGLSTSQKERFFRQTAAELLGNLGDRSAVGSVKALLGDGSESVREEAQKALGKLGIPLGEVIKWADAAKPKKPEKSADAHFFESVGRSLSSKLSNGPLVNRVENGVLRVFRPRDASDWAGEGADEVKNIPGGYPYVRLYARAPLPVSFKIKLYGTEKTVLVQSQDWVPIEVEIDPSKKLEYFAIADVSLISDKEYPAADVPLFELKDIQLSSEPLPAQAVTAQSLGAGLGQGAQAGDVSAYMIAGMHSSLSDLDAIFGKVRTLLPPFPQVLTSDENRPELVFHLEVANAGLMDTILRDGNLTARFGIRSPDDEQALLKAYEAWRPSLERDRAITQDYVSRGIVPAEIWDKGTTRILQHITALFHQGYRVKVYFEYPDGRTWWTGERSNLMPRQYVQAFLTGNEEESLRTVKLAKALHEESDNARDFNEEGPKINQRIAANPKATHFIIRGMGHLDLFDSLSAAEGKNKERVFILPEGADFEDYLPADFRLIRLKHRGLPPGAEGEAVELQHQLQTVFLGVFLGIVRIAGVPPLKYYPPLNRVIAKFQTADILRLLRSMKNVDLPLDDTRFRRYEVYERIKHNFPEYISGDREFIELIESSILQGNGGKAYVPQSLEIPAAPEIEGASLGSVSAQIAEAVDKELARLDDKIIIACVCSQNMQRSPTVEILLEKMLRDRNMAGQFAVMSAGLNQTHVGPMPEPVFSQAVSYGVAQALVEEIRDRFSVKPLDRKFVEAAHLILVAEQDMRRKILEKFADVPGIKAKIIAFSELEESKGDLPDNIDFALADRILQVNFSALLSRAVKNSQASSLGEERFPVRETTSSQIGRHLKTILERDLPELNGRVRARMLRVLEELLKNVIEHGYRERAATGDVVLTTNYGPEGSEFTILDQGKRFNQVRAMLRRLEEPEPDFESMTPEQAESYFYQMQESRVVEGEREGVFGFTILTGMVNTPQDPDRGIEIRYNRPKGYNRLTVRFQYAAMEQAIAEMPSQSEAQLLGTLPFELPSFLQTVLPKLNGGVSVQSEVLTVVYVAGGFVRPYAGSLAALFARSLEPILDLLQNRSSTPSAADPAISAANEDISWILNRPYFIQRGVRPASSAQTARNVALLLDMEVLSQSTPEQIKHLADNLKRGDLVMAFWNGEGKGAGNRQKPKALSGLIKQLSSKGIRVTDILSERPTREEIRRGIPPHLDQGILVSNVKGAYGDLQVSIETDRFRFDTEKLLQAGMDPNQAVALLRQIAEVTDKNKRFELYTEVLGAASFDAASNSWMVGSNLINFIKNLSAEDAATKSLARAA